MLTIAAAGEQGEGCWATRKCGNLNISQPFWLRDTETAGACGLLDFEVKCNNSSTPILRTTIGYGFRILGISYEERSLSVVDIYDKNASRFCHVPGWNTSANLGLPYKISTGNLNLVLYNCTAEAAAVARRDSKLVPMRCGKESNAFVRGGGFYNGTSEYAGDAVEGCHATVVPVLSSKSGAANASNYEQLISDGFLVTWDPLPARKFNHPSKNPSRSVFCQDFPYQTTLTALFPTK
jgi:hypothetical protein